MIARIGRAAGDDQLAAGARAPAPRTCVEVDPLVLAAHAVADRLEPLAREVRRRAVGQMAAGGERHAEDGVAGLQQRQEHRLVGRCAAVRLHVGEARSRTARFARSIASCSATSTILAAAVVAPPRIALGVLVGQHRALRLEHGGARRCSPTRSARSGARWRSRSSPDRPEKSRGRVLGSERSKKTTRGEGDLAVKSQRPATRNRHEAFRSLRARIGWRHSARSAGRTIRWPSGQCSRTGFMPEPPIGRRRAPSYIGDVAAVMRRAGHTIAAPHAQEACRRSRPGRRECADPAWIGC